MDDEKREILRFTCPGCSGIASPSYTKRQLEKALEVGEIGVYHIICDHHWKIKLEPQDKENIKNFIDRGFISS